MARWELMQPHYLNVESLDGQPVEWTYEETNRDTGRRAVRRFPVPHLLDPKNPVDYNYPGQIIVCHAGKGQPRDYVFSGPPTAEMEPLDDEAREISRAEQPKWVNPMGEGAFPGQGNYNDALLNTLTRQLEAIINKQGIPQAVPNQAIPGGEVDALRQMVSALQAQVAELIAKQEGIKLVVDTEEPLPPPEAIPAPANERRV